MKASCAKLGGPLFNRETLSNIVAKAAKTPLQGWGFSIRNLLEPVNLRLVVAAIALLTGGCMAAETAPLPRHALRVTHLKPPTGCQ